MTPVINGISSMATKAVLARLVDAYQARAGRNVVPSRWEVSTPPDGWPLESPLMWWCRP